MLNHTLLHIEKKGKGSNFNLPINVEQKMIVVLQMDAYVLNKNKQEYIAKIFNT